jgi:cellulose synthase/poly-beta-1,6-N-acetylglucosamine synthase-like glycosyltransferase
VSSFQSASRATTRPFVAEAIRSVLEQTYDAFELVVVDDGSVDESAEIVARLGVRCLRQERKGPSAARFRALLPHRYAMYYRHWPGRGVRVLSKPVLLPLATAAFRGVNRVAGRFGNKLAVQAVRDD